ncbi:hypothetical protein HDV00_004713 [Rhizophlyctis rosea]|nr:hypothetical protein HDV00_004713 [Rhizophlyctis rosea]
MCTQFREAAFMTPPGDTLKNFWSESALEAALSCQYRIRHLRTLSLISNPCVEIIDLVFSQIRIPQLRTLALKDCGTENNHKEGQILQAICGHLANASRPLALEKFTIDTDTFAHPSSTHLYTTLLESLADAPLKELAILSARNVSELCPANFNNTIHNLMSLTITSILDLEDLSTAAPNLNTLTINTDCRVVTEPYPLQNVFLPSLSTIVWCATAVKHISISNNRNNFNQNFLKIHKHFPTLQSLVIRPYLLFSHSTTTYPTLDTVAELFKVCKELTKLDTVLKTFDKAKVIELCTARPTLKVLGFILADRTPPYGLAEIRSKTGVRLFLRGAWDPWKVLEE